MGDAEDEGAGELVAAPLQTAEGDAPASAEGAAANYVTDSADAAQAAGAADTAADPLYAAKAPAAADADPVAEAAGASDVYARQHTESVSASESGVLQETLQEAAEPEALHPDRGSRGDSSQNYSGDLGGAIAGPGLGRQRSWTETSVGVGSFVCGYDGYASAAENGTAGELHEAAAVATGPSASALPAGLGGASLPACEPAVVSQLTDEKAAASPEAAGGPAADADTQPAADFVAADSVGPGRQSSTAPLQQPAAAKSAPEVDGARRRTQQPNAALQLAGGEAAAPQLADGPQGMASGSAANDPRDQAAAISRDPADLTAGNLKQLDLLAAAPLPAADQTENRQRAFVQPLEPHRSDIQSGGPPHSEVQPLDQQLSEGQPFDQQRSEDQPSEQRRSESQALKPQPSEDQPAAATSRTDRSYGASYDAISAGRAASAGSSAGSSDGSSGRLDASDTGAAKLPSLEWLLLDAASCGAAASVPHTPQSAENAATAAEAAAKAGTPAEEGAATAAEAAATLAAAAADDDATAEAPQVLTWWYQKIRQQQQPVIGRALMTKATDHTAWPCRARQATLTPQLPRLRNQQSGRRQRRVGQAPPPQEGPCRRKGTQGRQLLRRQTQRMLRLWQREVRTRRICPAAISRVLQLLLRRSQSWRTLQASGGQIICHQTQRRLLQTAVLQGRQAQVTLLSARIACA